MDTQCPQHPLSPARTGTPPSLPGTKTHVASGRSIQRHSARYPPGTAIAERKGHRAKNRHSPSQLSMPPTNRLLQFHHKPDEKQLQQKQRKNKFDRLVHRKSSHSQSFAHIRIDASLYISSYRSRMQSILPWYFHSCNYLQFTSLPFVRSPHKICPHSGKERGCCSLCRSSSLPPRQLLTKQPVTVAIPVQHSAASGGKASLSAALGIKLDQFKTV